MAETLILKTNQTPTYFNKDAAIGLLIPGIGIIGAVVGAFIGKDRMEKEAAVGKPVGEPTFWNKDALLGGLLGQALGAIAMLAVVAAAPFMPVIAPAVAEGAGLLLAAGGLAGLVTGVFLGGDAGKERMLQEYTMAAVQSHEQAGRSHAQEPQQAMAEEKGHTKNHAQEIIAARQRDAAEMIQR
ncbi:MAG: hypothetical protein SFX19_03695 [Alphaproteobacteria bacterium]|nr:hypothetical protein [Alphaproteobacteria bacterium]